VPLDIRGQFGNKVWRSCQLKTCTKFAGKRAYYMGHFMGNLCQTHAKEWEQAWNSALPVADDA
jgi:hypothetical protein